MVDEGRREYLRRYWAKPENRERARESKRRHRTKPGVLSRARDYARTYRTKYPDRQRESHRRYLEKPGIRAARLENDRRYRAVPEHRERKNALRRTRYRTDSDYRQRIVELQRLKQYTRREKSRYDHWKRKYGISVEDYAARFAEQGGVCAICRKPETMLANNGQDIRALAIDHDHTTKRVRGLLCSKCNTVLGLVQDHPEILRQAVQYLGEWWQGGQSVSQTMRELGGA